MLYREFRFFEGQPIRIFTEDDRVHCGIVAKVFENAVKLIKRRTGTPEFIPFCHIVAIDEPQMHLHRCDMDDCGCDKRGHKNEREEDCGCEEGEEFERRRYR